MALVIRRQEGYYVEPTPTGPTKPEREIAALPPPPVPRVERVEVTETTAAVVRLVARVPWVFVASLALNLALLVVLIRGLR